MKLAGSSGAGQELKSRFAMPVLRFCSGAVLLLAGLYGALLCFFQTFALPEAETALIWSLPTTLLFLIIYSLPKHRGLAYLAAFVLWGIAAFFVMREVVTGAVFVAEQFSSGVGRVSKARPFRTASSAGGFSGLPHVFPGGSIPADGLSCLGGDEGA